MKPRNLGCLLLAFAMATAGCALPELQDGLIALKNRSWAKVAWAQEYRRYCKQPRPIRQAFGAGWREAYYDVAQGGSGKIPLFPPTEYWGVKYQNPMGRDQIDAWFAGYRKGSLAAEQDNAGYWIQIPMSGGNGPPKADVTTATTEPPAEQVPAPEPGRAALARAGGSAAGSANSVHAGDRHNPPSGKPHSAMTTTAS